MDGFSLSCAFVADAHTSCRGFSCCWRLVICRRIAAWLNIAHAAVMVVMSIHLPHERQDLIVASALFGIIGVAPIAVAPKRVSTG